MTWTIVILAAALSLTNGDRFDVQFKALENKVETYREEIEANKLEIEVLKSLLDKPRQSRVEACNVVRTIPKSCRDIAKLGVTEPGIFKVDFDGADGLQAIDVYCDFEKRTTTIGRVFEKEMKPCSRPDCFNMRVYQDAPLEQLRALIKGSKYCQQNITVECTRPPTTAKDNKFLTWMDFKRNPNEVKGNFQCNTNENVQYQVIVLDDEDVRYNDVVVLDDLSLLPVANVAFDPRIDPIQKVKVSVGPLRCTYESFDDYILIVSGFMGFSASNLTEAINLKKRKKCQNFHPDFPARIVHATGNLVSDRPIICGGSDDPTGKNVKTDCWMLTLRGWEKTKTQMNQMRALPASVVFQDSLIIAGGYNSRDYMLASTEVMTSTSTLQFPNMKTEAYGHCMVSFNDKIMVIGGFGRNGITAETHIYDSGFKFISDGPSMIHARSGHGCGIFYEPAENDHQLVIVVGSFSANANTAEILDLSVAQGRWRLSKC